MSASGQPRDKLNKDQRHAIIEAYKAGDKYREIAARFGVSESCVWAVVSRAAITRNRLIVEDSDLAHARAFCKVQRAVRQLPNPPPEIPPSRTRRKAVNEFAFDTITPESAYWLGMLITDGSVQIKRYPAIVLALCAADRGHVVSFRSFMDAENKITDVPGGVFRPISPETKPIVGTGSSRISIYSKRLAQVLIQHGVTPLKSLNAEATNVAMHPDFWRGTIDGDGSVSCREGVRLCGSRTLLNQFVSFIEAICPHSRVVVRERPFSKIFDVETHGKTAAIILDSLYNTPGPALPRKRDRAMKFLHRFLP